MQMSENQKLITVAETAVKLGVTSQTISLPELSRP